MEKCAYLSSAYLAPVQYYTKLYSFDKIYLEQYEHYTKQTYRNRCVIASADGPLTLSIPTEKADTPKCLMKDIRISDHGNWRHLHWNAIESAYRSTPFFDYYRDDFFPFYEKKHTFLFDFNEQLCALVCELIDLSSEIRRTEEYVHELSSGVSDFRALIHPKHNYQTEDRLFAPQPYYQVFEARHGFLPNMSMIDLLFNMGPESLLVLTHSVVNTL